MYGIDVSGAQSGLNIKGTGAQFCIIKATDGTRFVAKSCDPFVQECEKNGILWGFYHFANGAHKSSMRAQAEYFVQNCRNYFGQGIPVLDWEDSSEKYGGAVLKYGPSAAKEFLDRVYEQTGIRPMIYMSASVTTAYDWSEVAKDYGLWGAGYARNATYSNPKTNVFHWGAWGSPAIHQYGNSSGQLDVNIAYTDKAGWLAFVGGEKAEKPAQATKPTQKAEPTGTTLELAVGVMEGKYGNGGARENALGSRYKEVQGFINHVASASASTLASEVWQGKYGNGNTRKTVLGARYVEVQALVEEKLKKQYYGVRRGDTLYKIAKQHGTTVANLAKLNPQIKNLNMIYPGQKIRVK